MALHSYKEHRAQKHHIFQSVLRQCEGGEGLGQNLLVAAVLITFPHHFIAQNAIALTHLIAGCSHPGEPLMLDFQIIDNIENYLDMKLENVSLRQPAPMG